jgi:hypothetical protein
MLGGLLACLVVFGVARYGSELVPVEWRRALTSGAVIVVATAMMITLTLLLRPRRPKPIEVTADHDGVFADGVPLILRQDIFQAYIRPRLNARTSISGSPGNRIVIGLPNYPLTVEIIRREGAQLNLDPGGEQAAAAMLTAMGIPVTMCAADYRGNLRPKRSQTFLTVVIVIVFLAALFGFSYWKSTGH